MNRSFRTDRKPFSLTKAGLILAMSASLLSPVGIHAAEGEMHRMYNPNSGEHFYTSSLAEAQNIYTAGWDYEGIAWVGAGGEPVYRLYNPNAGDHHYTTSAGERDSLVKVGWKDEGIGWTSDQQKRTPLYRLYNPNAKTGTHHYTTSAGERDSLVRAGWRDEGIGWYAAEPGHSAGLPFEDTRPKPSNPAPGQNPGGGGSQTGGGSQGDVTGQGYYVNTQSGKFHRPGCRTLPGYFDGKWTRMNVSRAQMIAYGYSPCKICKP